jgi:hypothetical protein
MIIIPSPCLGTVAVVIVITLFGNVKVCSCKFRIPQNQSLNINLMTLVSCSRLDRTSELDEFHLYDVKHTQPNLISTEIFKLIFMLLNNIQLIQYTKFYIISTIYKILYYIKFI